MVLLLLRLKSLSPPSTLLLPSASSAGVRPAIARSTADLPIDDDENDDVPCRASPPRLGRCRGVVIGVVVVVNVVVVVVVDRACLSSLAE